ncbi:MAG: DoxX family protein [Burkholderiales bacterium]|nr:DoxX family protein [Opitutaceae bacterium]
MSFLSRTFRTDAATAAPLILRLALGAVFIGHGGQKLFGWWGGKGFESTAKYFEGNLDLEPGTVYAALAGGGEFFGGILLVLGLLTRFAAAQAAIIMAVAIWLAHRSAFFLQDNGMEFALVLMLIAVSLVLTGGGALSIDAHLAKPSTIAPKK